MRGRKMKRQVRVLAKSPQGEALVIRLKSGGRCRWRLPGKVSKSGLSSTARQCIENHLGVSFNNERFVPTLTAERGREGVHVATLSLTPEDKVAVLAGGHSGIEVAFVSISELLHMDKEQFAERELLYEVVRANTTGR